MKDADKLTHQHLATLDKWAKLVKAEGDTRDAYLRLLQRELYAKVKF